MALFGNLFGPPQQPGMQPAAPLPRVPWSQNPAITTAALSLLGGRNLNEGLANVAATAGQGMAAKSNLQGFMMKRQEEDAAKAAQRAAWNAGMKWKSGLPLTPEEQSALAGAPEVSLKFMPETPQMYRPLTDPAERAKFGIPETDTAPYQVGPDNKVMGVGGGGTSVNVNTGEKLTEGQSKDVNFYARGRASNDELTPDLEKALTDLPASLWSNAPVLGNYAVTPQFQTAKRAASEFLAVILRKDTGAAVTPAEFELYGPMYLPVPGDSEEAIAAKREARVRALSSLKRGLGTARGLADEIDAEMANGQPQPTPQQSVPGASPTAPISAADYFKQ